MATRGEFVVRRSWAQHHLRHRTSKLGGAGQTKVPVQPHLSTGAGPIASSAQAQATLVCSSSPSSINPQSTGRLARSAASARPPSPGACASQSTSRSVPPLSNSPTAAPRAVGNMSQTAVSAPRTMSVSDAAVLSAAPRSRRAFSSAVAATSSLILRRETQSFSSTSIPSPMMQQTTTAVAAPAEARKGGLQPWDRGRRDGVRTQGGGRRRRRGLEKQRDRSNSRNQRKTNSERPAVEEGGGGAGRDWYRCGDAADKGEGVSAQHCSHKAVTHHQTGAQRPNSKVRLLRRRGLCLCRGSYLCGRSGPRQAMQE